MGLFEFEPPPEEYEERFCDIGADLLRDAGLTKRELVALGEISTVEGFDVYVENKIGQPHVLLHEAEVNMREQLPFGEETPSDIEVEDAFPLPEVEAFQRELLPSILADAHPTAIFRFYDDQRAVLTEFIENLLQCSSHVLDDKYEFLQGVDVPLMKRRYASAAITPRVVTTKDGNMWALAILEDPRSGDGMALQVEGNEENARYMAIADADENMKLTRAVYAAPALYRLFLAQNLQNVITTRVKGLRKEFGALAKKRDERVSSIVDEANGDVARSINTLLINTLRDVKHKGVLYIIFEDREASPPGLRELQIIKHGTVLQFTWWETSPVSGEPRFCQVTAQLHGSGKRFQLDVKNVSQNRIIDGSKQDEVDYAREIVKRFFTQMNLIDASTYHILGKRGYDADEVLRQWAKTLGEAQNLQQFLEAINSLHEGTMAARYYLNEWRRSPMIIDDEIFSQRHAGAKTKNN